MGTKLSRHSLRAVDNRERLKPSGYERLDEFCLKISYLDNKFAKLPNNEEIKDIQKAIEESVSSLLASVAANDPRFESKLELSGSFYEGTKIRQPLWCAFPDSRKNVRRNHRCCGSI